jgi:hypothetical protein
MQDPIRLGQYFDGPQAFANLLTVCRATSTFWQNRTPRIRNRRCSGPREAANKGCLNSGIANHRDVFQGCFMVWRLLDDRR